jgi:hypothetical protein
MASAPQASVGSGMVAAGQANPKLGSFFIRVRKAASEMNLKEAEYYGRQRKEH